MAHDNTRYLKTKIKNRKAVIGIIGLGYVGLPLALAFAKKGFNVIGIEIDKDRVKNIKKGVSYITDISNGALRDALRKRTFQATSDSKLIRKLDAVIICVPTPLGKDREPDISYIRQAVTKVKDNIRKGQIVVLESTTYPGTTREILLPILESGGLKEGKDFYLIFSPERVDPGNESYRTENTPKIIGGISRRSTEIAKLLYDQIISEVVPVSSASAAEMVKLLENTFRIVNIALVNEIALLCEKFGMDIWEIIDAAKTKPYGYMPFYPGPGVGGHCIPVDPLYLSWKAKEHGFETKFIDLASSINESMPQNVVERLEKLLADRKKTLDRSNILLLGISYKKDVKDLRESPSIGVITILQKRRAKLSYYDPYFPFLKLNGIDMKPIKLDKRELEGFDCALVLTDHSGIDYRFLASNLKLIFDTRNIFGRLGIKSRNIVKL
ncbi:MAG: UDP-N-acetyl-D-glucosamine dehydrogenase [Omnitrophica bacterium RBG_13_46_9]|nr:MAG: UDP-N-acetyl-D-glucosamine dehydrogenase [Omnitrophica bacterium RBG_13_46_9]